MGRLLRIEPCPVCNYHVESELFFGGSTRTRLFLYHRYLVAACHNCANVVSTLALTPDHDIPYMLEAAEKDIETLTSRMEAGDPVARRLLPLHLLALEGTGDDDADLVAEIGLCTMCGSDDLTLYTSVGGDEGEHFDDGSAWVACPRCEEGLLWLRTIGHWDEIDSGI